jgi:beta-barrel assembly-enhancing protease
VLIHFPGENMKLRINPFLCLTLCFLLSGCASKKYADRHREGDNSGQLAALTVEEEKKLTQQALAEMRKEYPPAANKEIQEYLQRIGQKIVRANNLHQRPYSYNFTVVDSAQINAFAMPAGEIFMTAPIIAAAESEAEIAGVLGHEIGHVVARHTAERMYVAKKEQGKMWLYGGVGAALGGAAGFFLGKKLCKEGDTACKAKLTAYGAGGGAVGGLMVQKYGFMKNSQEDELESDRVGFRYAVKAGYDKTKVGDFYRKLMAMEEQSKKGQNAFIARFSDAMSSHPPSKSRVQQAQEMQSLITENGGITTTEEFQRIKKIAQQIVAKNKTGQSSGN